MKRFQFIVAAMFGFGAAAKAQTICGSSDPEVCRKLAEKKAGERGIVLGGPGEPPPGHPGPRGPIVPAWMDGKPLNNQCPVCGTMAKPFVPPPDWEYFPAGYFENQKPINLACCTHCNNAFWQRPEPTNNTTPH